MLPLVGFDPHCRKLFFRGFRRKPIQEIVVDELYNFGFLRFNDELVTAPTVAVYLKLAVGNALLKAFARTPLYIFGNAATFLLGEGRKDSQHQFAIAVHGIDVLFFEPHLYTDIFQAPYRLQQIHRIARKPLN